MRELKFRAWANDHWTDFLPTCRTLGEYNANIIDTDSNFCGRIVEQYTGLKDKNGKEIYEGDIVVNTYYDDGEMYIILWVDDSVAFGMESLDDMELYKLPLESLEVIGNIHENPELLKKEK